jgi:hypothetical protein
MQLDPENDTEEQKRYASTPIAAYTIAAALLLVLVLGWLSS